MLVIHRKTFPASSLNMVIETTINCNTLNHSGKVVNTVLPAVI